MMRARVFGGASVFGATLMLIGAALGCSEGSSDGGTDTGTGGSEQGTGGTSSVAGGTSTGGTSAAGSTATGGSSSTGTPQYTFDSGLEGWEFAYSENLQGEGGATNDCASAGLCSVTHNATDGDPDPGCLEVTGEFEANDQKVQAQINLPAATDLSGRTITARVRLVSGLSSDPSYPGGAMLFIKSTTDAWVWADGGWFNLETEGEWIELSLNVDVPQYIDEANPNGTYDPTQILAIGVHVATGSDNVDSWEPAVVQIDTISW